jgi:hypothetical protein
MLTDQPLGNRHRLDSDAGVAATHMAFRKKLVRHAIDSRDRDRDGRRARQARGIDAENASGCVGERTAGEAIVDRQVQSNESIDSTALPRAPLTTDRADGAETGGDAVARPADGDNKRADAEHVVRSHRRDGC